MAHQRSALAFTPAIQPRRGTFGRLEARSLNLSLPRNNASRFLVRRLLFRLNYCQLVGA